MDGTGWDFGRPVHMGEVYALLQRLPGTELVEDVRLFAANPITGQRGQAAQRVEVAANALVFSYQHQVRVEETVAMAFVVIGASDSGARQPRRSVRPCAA